MGLRGPHCSICRHDKRPAIDLALASLLPQRTIARRFGVTYDAVKWHAKNHLSPQMRAALLTARRPNAVDLEELERSEGEGLLAALIHQRARLAGFSEQAIELGDVRAGVAVERAIRENLELVGKLLGQFAIRHEITRTSILITSDYLALRTAIVDALKPFPEAARAVGAALHRLETAAAERIKEDAANGKAPLLIEAMPEEVAPC